MPNPSRASHLLSVVDRQLHPLLVGEGVAQLIAGGGGGGGGGGREEEEEESTGGRKRNHKQVQDIHTRSTGMMIVYTCTADEAW